METTRRIRDSIEPTQSSAREVYRLQRTVEAARLLYSTLDLSQLTSIILEIIRTEVPVERVSAFVLDRKQDVVRSLVAQGVDGFAISIPVGQGIAGYVAHTGQALDVPDAYADPRFNSEVDRILNYRTQDVLALPILKSDGEIVGVLELLNRERPIREEDLEFLQDVSVFIGLALENARLLEELQLKARLEEEVVRSRERLSQMDRLVLISEVLSTVMNELATPARVVLRQTALMKTAPDISENMLRNIEFIESATTRSTEAVSRFLDFVQKQKGERGPVDVRDLVRQTVASRASQWAMDGIEVAQFLDNDTPFINGNYGEIQQALMHVLKNAEDAVASRESERRLTVLLTCKNPRKVRIDVEDNGSGIPTEIYERVFEPFFSTKRETARTGLGLTIANRIIQEHHGEILFDTTLGRGTIFTIELPI